MNPLVSIHIVTYNQIQFIHETLAPALEQDYDNLEVVVADDGSTDGTAEVILDYAKKYPKRLVPLVGGPNLGCTGNSNRALRACKGVYIAFLPGDDVFLPGKISKQVKWMQQDHKRVLCGHHVEVFYQDNSHSPHLYNKKPLTSGHGPTWLIKNGVPYGNTSIMVRRDAIPEYGFDDRLPLVPDGKLWIDVLMNGGEFGYIDGVYAKYRKHLTNTTATKPFQILEDYRRMYDILEKEHPEHRVCCQLGRGRKVKYGLGKRKELDGLYLEATKYYLRGIKLDPTYFKLYLRLGMSVLQIIANRIGIPLTPS